MDTRLPKHVPTEVLIPEPKLQISFKTKLAEEARQQGFDCWNEKGVLTFYLSSKTEADAEGERQAIREFLGLSSPHDIPPFSYAMKARREPENKQVVQATILED